MLLLAPATARLCHCLAQAAQASLDAYRAIALERRGNPGDGAWRWAWGRGYVPPRPGAYARAQAAGCDVRCLLFETFGGWSPDVVELFRELAEERGNRLYNYEYDATTWSARTWLSFQAQKLSVALQYAVALELSNALGLANASDQGC